MSKMERKMKNCTKHVSNWSLIPAMYHYFLVCVLLTVNFLLIFRGLKRTLLRPKGVRIMFRKIAKTTLYATIVASVLCAGTVSARQLRSEAQQTACGGRCQTKLDCSPGCFCSFTTPFTPGFCTTRPAGLKPSAK